MCENAKILCPYCLTREIDPAQAICSACYSKEDKWERGSWDDLRKRKNADEIQMFTIAKKVDEAFQIPENEAYPLRSSLDLKLPAARQLPQWGAKPVPVALCGSSVYSQEMTSPLGVTIFLLPERGFLM